MMYELGISKDVIGATVGHGADDGDKSARTLIRHYLKSDLIELQASAMRSRGMGCAAFQGDIILR